MLEEIHAATSLFLTSPPAQTSLAWLIVIALGLTLGSFLNVVIYRLGEQMKDPNCKLGVNFPRRSFCPSCKADLRWSENIPVISYVVQKGRCGNCQIAIPSRYPMIELAGLLAIAIPWIMAPTVTIAVTSALFLIALIAATGIDIETKKIPNKVTLPALALVLALAFAPGGIGKSAILGAGACFLMMVALAQLGKWLFGKKTIKLKESPNILWDGSGLTIQEPGKSLAESERMGQEDLPFSRPDDRITIEGDFLFGRGAEQVPRTTIVLAADTPEEVTGTLRSITYPREAMGMGDAKLLALCGAVLGFEGAVQGLAAGAVVALGFIIILRLGARMAKKNPPELIAFGPWIAAGCTAVLIWGWTCAAGATSGCGL
jgi:prepilin signal peptidase PulO-like enzyme (type II secretory pathway)